jgi:arginine decarboxylase
MGLDITVRGATGRGPTVLAAFDDALVQVGVANLNLIRLSSVIPPGSRVRAAGADPAQDLRSDGARWGDRLFAVWAFQSAERLGEEAWAGVAWAQDPDGGHGVFVEHEGGSESQVRGELDATLDSLLAARAMHCVERGCVVVGTRCEIGPVGALVIAPFRSSAW